jgi:hypothetical protein
MFGLIPGFIQKLFRPKAAQPRGILLFGTVQEVIRVQKLLQKEGFRVRLVAPPPEVRVGCDLAVEFELLEQEALEAAVKAAAYFPARTVSTKEMLPDILKRVVFVAFDGFLMAKAGNMKISADTTEWRIVNISGGGCPDIPFVAEKLYGKRISEAPDPVALGNSLCSFMLQIAFDALKARVVKP